MIARHSTDNDESRRLYDLYQQAKQTGGPCEVCGWRDGDGVKTCFYSAELGAVTHQNSDAGAALTMTPAQRSLFRLRMVTAFASEAHRAQCMADVDARHRAQHKAHDAAGYAYPFCVDADGHELSDDDWIANYAAREAKLPIATDEPYASWVWRPGDAYRVICFEPHECGGIREFLGPYHFGCSGCDTEVKLWEHGIDYDVG